MTSHFGVVAPVALCLFRIEREPVTDRHVTQVDAALAGVEQLQLRLDLVGGCRTWIAYLVVDLERYGTSRECGWRL